MSSLQGGPASTSGEPGQSAQAVCRNFIELPRSPGKELPFSCSTRPAPKHGLQRQGQEHVQGGPAYDNFGVLAQETSQHYTESYVLRQGHEGQLIALRRGSASSWGRRCPLRLSNGHEADKGQKVCCSAVDVGVCVLCKCRSWGLTPCRSSVGVRGVVSRNVKEPLIAVAIMGLRMWSTHMCSGSAELTCWAMVWQSAIYPQGSRHMMLVTMIEERFCSES